MRDTITFQKIIAKVSEILANAYANSSAQGKVYRHRCRPQLQPLTPLKQFTDGSL
eukprot:m.285501 g.285501  ORF g.285501 m.285501 type:complete len:55 (+) comp40685_c0_seq3:1635-1799(+)